MRLSWRERIAQQPQWRDPGDWPLIDTDRLPAHKRSRFLRNRQIVVQVLDGQPMHEVAARHQVSPGWISQLMRRCLGGDEETPPALNRALLPNYTLTDRQRQSPLPTLARPCGSQCGFQWLLQQLPEVSQALDELIKASLADRDYAQQLTPRALFGEFKRALAAAHWPGDRYPYTSKSQGYHAVRRYMGIRRDDFLRARGEKRSAPALITTTTRYERSLRLIQIDEHKMDLEDRVHLLLNDELIPLRLPAATLLTAQSEGSNAVLGYHLAPTKAANQDDLLTLISNCLTPWAPLNLQTPGLEYQPGAGFPSMFAAVFPISFGLVKLDNALMHHANSVKDFLCTQMGATLSFGRPATPTVRYLVESTFDYIETHVGHRTPSTTGSYPTDPKKESRRNRRNPPLIAFQTVNEALSVLLSGYNATPSAALGGAAPLAVHEHHVRNHYTPFVSPEVAQLWHPLLSSMPATLHWYQHEHRRPHIHFMYERYYGPGLLEVAGRERKVRVVFDRRDIRTLHVYTLDGRDLGVVQVSYSWQRFPHSMATRRWIHDHQKTLRFNMRDPLAALFHYLLEHRDTPSTALSLLRVYTEFSSNFTTPVVLNDSADTPVVDAGGESSLGTSISHYVWTPEIANHRRAP